MLSRLRLLPRLFRGRASEPPRLPPREASPRAEAAALGSVELGEVLGVALRAGQVMVESGANAARVEEVIIRFGQVSSIADLFRGDTLSGLVRATSAVLIVGTIGAGLFLVLLVSTPHMGLTLRAPPPLWAATLWGFIAALGFAVLLDVPRHTLVWGGLAGAVGLAMRNGLLLLFPSAPHEAAMFFAGFVIALVSEAIAYVLRLPTSIFAIPGFIPLVPGVLAFRTVLGARS